jgi:hypothetical protein
MAPKLSTKVAAQVGRKPSHTPTPPHPHTPSLFQKKAQSSMELLILMGFLTFVIISILSIGYFYSNTINDRLKSNQIANFANKITYTSETVFYAGAPSKSTISAHLPDSVQTIQIIDNALIITYTLATGQNTAAYPSNVPISQNPSAPITTTSGIKNILIQANETHAIISQN